MEQRTVGRSGLRVSRIGLATHTWGRETGAEDAAVQLVAFVEAGGTLLDTSPTYGGGTAQRILGELMSELVPRDDLMISGCAGIAAVPVTNPDGAPGPELRWRVDASRRTLLRQLDRTLAELGTDYLDIWSVAAWDPHTPLDEIGATLDDAVRSGKVRYAGVRGLEAWQLATMACTAPITAAHTPYSLLARGVEHDIVPAAQHHGIGLIATTPLAWGILTGKYRDGVPADSRGADEAEDPVKRATRIREHLDDHAARVVDALVTAADGLGTSPLAVALAWVRDRPAVSSLIVGARDMGQLTGILAAETVELPRAIAAALDDVSSI
jgi:aryl-alcohol dehydrogenase-like predicted oxidoreductase